MKKTLALALLAAVATPAAAADFTGFHVGASLGLDRAAYDNRALAIDESFGGIMYGAALGYDFGIGSAMTLGAELTLEDSTADYDVTNGGNRGAVDASRDFGAVARVGFKAGDSMLVYGLAGYSQTRVNAFTTIANVTTRASGNADGFRVGAGVEFMLSKNLFTKVEYRYTDYEGGFSRNQVRLGAGFRF